MLGTISTTSPEPDQQDLLDPPDQLDQLGLRVRQALRDRKVIRGLLERLVLPDPKAPKAILEMTEQLGRPALRVHKVLRGTLAQPVVQVLLDLPVLKETEHIL